MQNISTTNAAIPAPSVEAVAPAATTRSRIELPGDIHKHGADGFSVNGSNKSGVQSGGSQTQSRDTDPAANRTSQETGGDSGKNCGNAKESNA
jgi:hypothetical protein